MSDAKKTLVLVADDEPSTRALVANHMQNRGFEVIEAVDGDEAWTLAHEHLPDLVILDVMMPGMSGWEVCRRIRDAVSLAHTGVVMLTGIGENLNEMTSPLYGADAYIDKPFEFSQLDARVQETLERRREGSMGRPDGADVVELDQSPESVPPASEQPPSVSPSPPESQRSPKPVRVRRIVRPKLDQEPAPEAEPSEPPAQTVAKKPAKKAAKKPAKKAAKKPAKKAAKKPAKKAAKKPAKKAAKKPARKLPKKPARKLPKKAPRKPARKLPRKPARKLPKKPARKLPKKAPKKPARKLPRKPARKLPKKAPKKPARKLPKKLPKRSAAVARRRPARRRASKK